MIYKIKTDMTVTIDNIPVFQALVDDEGTGMLRISLVDSPAVMSDFLAFREEKIPVMYRVQDEEKRLVRGVVMRADFPIYRRDARAGGYYIIYKADTDWPKANVALPGNVKSGYKGTVSVNVDTSDMPEGEMLVTMTLTTNSPTRPIVNLFLTGWIE